ncbi:hypothetical protein B0H10DRAFT_2212014 [Mycena sp. CBHHK59/15]|nr:hypothetical protein B0H10DRAFT_2212014 [Mycena sp. CBHHK59/15]
MFLKSFMQANISVYAQAFLLTSTTAAYRGLNAAEHILKAMRELNLTNLPSEKERLAFLRLCVWSYSTLNDEDFWLKVDSVMASYRKEAGTEVEISQLFTDIYADDKIRYGNPEETGRITERIEDADHWHKTLAKHAQNVQPHAAKTLKRKFAKVEPVNEEGASPTE